MKVLNLLSSGNLAGIEKLNIDIYNHSANTNIYCFMFKGGKAAEVLKENGAYVNVLDLKIKHSFLSQYRAIYKIARDNSIDAIVVHHETPIAWMIAPVIARKMNIPFYLYAHCEYKDIVGINTSSKLKYMYKKFTFRNALSKSDKVIAISKYVKNSIKMRYPAYADKINVVYNGIKNTVYYSDENSDSAFTIIYVGRLVKQKGVNLLIESIEKIDFPVKCIIVGDGEEKTNLENLVKALHLDEKICFAGVQYNTSEWYAKGDVFVHPAIWEEGFGITVIEAMASGLPCISFRKGALPEIIEDKVNGYLINEASSAALAEKISEIYKLKNTDVNSFACMRDNAKKTAEKFSIESTVEQLDKLFKK